MIAGTSLSIEIGGRVLLRDATFTVARGEKAGLVGRNGIGKSTLVSVVVGVPAAGIRVHGSARAGGTVGYLPQVPDPRGLGTDATGFSHVLSARGLDRLDDGLTRARRAMAEDPTDAAIEEFTTLESQFRHRGGYEVEGIVARLADGLGLRHDLLFDDIAELSGGQRRRLDLLRVLFGRPDTMVLDEPTNHLDLGAKKWLVEELARFDGALLVISHDIKLLDRSITKVLHLADASLREYKGTYSAYQAQRAADAAQRQRAAQLEGREITRLSTLADAMRGSTARRARIARSLDSRVARLESTRTVVERRDRRASFTLPAPRRSGATPLTVERLGVSYGAAPVLRGVTFSMGRGERVVVIGRNGAGKSSLLRCLAGVQAPSTGTVATGVHVTLGYFAQEHEQIDPGACVLDNIDDTVVPTVTARRSLLGSFGLTGALVEQMPATLSGGERAKLSLAMLAAGKANVLVLDEPTNNLDPGSTEAVGEMLSRWPGTIVAVSHDRAFVEQLRPTHCLHLPAERYTHWDDDYLEEVALR